MSVGSNALVGAVDYAMECLDTVRAADLDRPTPCSEWNLAALLGHLRESLTKLSRLAGCPAPGCASPGGNAIRGTEDDWPVGASLSKIRIRLESLCGGVDPAHAHEIGGLGLSRRAVAEVAALECVVHGWDIARSRDLRIDPPDPLAVDLLDAAHRLAPAHIRRDLFARPVTVPRDLSAADHLVAYLGRRPVRRRSPCAMSSGRERGLPT